MTDLYSFGTPFGGVKVAREASDDFQGLIEELAQAGAPIKNIGSYNYRNIAGTNVLSEHGKGKAIDIGNQQARNVVDPAFRAWVEENPERYSQILAKYNMRGGETFRNPDLGHVEWKGAGYGNPLREAAPIGGAVPENYDTEDRTAAGIGLVPRNEDVASTPSGQKRMANGDPTGILPALGMQNQQPQGLLGALGDPETMAYIGMMLKGMNPYSQIDPNAMLSAAHTNALKKQALMQAEAERRTDNQRADRALNLRESEYGLQREDRQARDAALFEERQQKRDLAAKQKEIDDEVRRNLGGGGRMPGEATPEATTVPEGTRSPEDQIAQLNAELAKNPSAPIAKSIERRIEQLQKGPSATTIRSIEKAENELAPLQATKDKLERMQQLLPNVAEGFGAGVYGNVGGRLPLGLAPQAAKDTLEFNNLAEIETVRDMSRTMKGSTAVKEMEVWLSKAADPSLPREIRQNNLNMAITAVNRELGTRSDRIKQLREGSYGRTPRSDGGATSARPPLSSFSTGE